MKRHNFEFETLVISKVIGPQQLVGGHDEFSRVTRTGLPDGSGLSVNHYV